MTAQAEFELPSDAVLQNEGGGGIMAADGQARQMRRKQRHRSHSGSPTEARPRTPDESEPRNGPNLRRGLCPRACLPKVLAPNMIRGGHTMGLICNDRQSTIRNAVGHVSNHARRSDRCGGRSTDHVGTRLRSQAPLWSLFWTEEPLCCGGADRRVRLVLATACGRHPVGAGSDLEMDLSQLPHIRLRL
jgi:hypothetical protein